MKIFQNFPPKPQALWRFFGEKIKNLKFCWKWSETFCFDMKRVLKLKKVEKSRISNFIGAREGGFFSTIQNRRIVTTTVTQTFRRTFHDVMFTALETVVTFCAINVILQGKDILCIKIGNILNNLTHEYSLSIEHDVILKIEHVFE